MKKIFYILFFIISFNHLVAFTQKKIVIVIPSFNNKFWFQRNLDSVINQNYENYEVIYIDDLSNDKTAELVEQYINSRNLHDKIKLTKNIKRQGALSNLYNAIPCHKILSQYKRP